MHKMNPLAWKRLHLIELGLAIVAGIGLLVVGYLVDYDTVWFSLVIATIVVAALCIRT